MVQQIVAWNQGRGMIEREYHSVNWEIMQAAWLRDEIRRGNNVQLPLLTDPDSTDTLSERLSSDGTSERQS
jgi:hypothetical protein